MEKQIISMDIMEYMVWVVEIVAGKFFNDDKTKAYEVLNEHGIWGMYVDHYEVTHTLGADYILREIGEMLTAKGVL